TMIHHPNLVNVKKVGHEHGLLYVVMDFVEGYSAIVLSGAKGGVPEDEALRIALEATLGLAEAHRSGVVHGDVKPENILVSAADGRARLADLGVALALDAARGSKATLSGTPLQAMSYLAPETVLDQPPTAAGDVYSMGATLYQLLAGEPPFAAPSPIELMEMILTAPAPEIRAKHPGVSAKTNALIAVCLEKDPTKRPKDGYEVAQLLASARVQLEAGLKKTHADGELPDAVKIPKPMGETTRLVRMEKTQRMDAADVRRRSVALATGVVFLVAAIGLGAFALRGAPPPTPPPPPAPTPTPPTPPTPPPPAPAPTPPTPPPTPPPAPPTPPPPAPPPPTPPPPAPPPPPPPPAPPPPPPAPPPPPPPPAEPPPPPAPVATADLPENQRVWDGHRWRRLGADHAHAKGCGHYRHHERWNLYPTDPRVLSYDVPDRVRNDPNSGVYEWDGKTRL